MDSKQYFYKYTVKYYEYIDDKPELKTASGLTFGSTFNDVCAKITDYFGEESLEDIKIEFASDCDVLEDFEIAELFNTEMEDNGENGVADTIKTGLNEAIEYEKGNLELRSTELSTTD